MSDSASSTLTGTTSRGFMWSGGIALIGKVISFIGRIVLASLLTREDFGMIGMAATIAAFAQFIAEPGFQILLIQRSKRIDRWAVPAFWMAITSGLFAGLVVFLIAPFVAVFYREPDLVGMLYVIALGLPLTSLSIIGRAYIRAQLRFRTLALVNFFQATSLIALTVLFAMLGFGAYSFVVPVPITYAAVGILTYTIARPPIQWRWQVRRWKYMLTDIRHLLSANLLIMVISQADYIILGRMHDARALGIYFLAFGLSMQTFYLLVSNLMNVLMPALNRLSDDPPRQLRAYLRISRLAAAVLIPACFLQALLADPLIRIFFDPVWYPAIPVMQLLSLGWSARCVGQLAEGMLQAQGRNSFWFIMCLLNASSFILVIYASALYGAEVSVAMGASIHAFTILGIFYTNWVVLVAGGKVNDTTHIFLRPMLFAVLGATVVLSVIHWTPRFAGFDIYTLIVTTIGFSTIYLALLRKFGLDLLSDILAQAPHGVKMICNRILLIP